MPKSGLLLYDTMRMKKAPFKPIGSPVRMFVCGPTVQGPPHLGHARTYVFYDVLARYLRHVGYEVEYVVNITDIDEKISRAAEEEGVGPFDVAERYSTRFIEDMRSLKVDSVDRYEKVSGYVGESIRQVSVLIDRGLGYVADGWVYFDTAKFRAFGKLSHQTKAELKLRPLELSPKKRNLTDFSLWRPESLVSGRWRSPWGMGSPGWHIQDTAITLSLLGPQYDIHGGAYELIYPHHEAEIAQAESITGQKPLVRYWLHTGHLNLGGEKMSKSLGNTSTITELLKKVPADAVRFFLLKSHYRSDMELVGIEKATDELSEARERLAGLSRQNGGKWGAAPSRTTVGFLDAMNDDIDTPRAIRWFLSRLRSSRSRADAPDLLACAAAASKILGVDFVAKA